MEHTVGLIFRVAMLLVLGTLWQATASATVLYDGTGGTTPNDPLWGWTYAPPIPGIMSATGGGTQLSTLSPLSTQVGFQKTVIQPRSQGYTIKFNVQILADDVELNNNDRSGFSIIALSDDLQGIELAFWDNLIFAQSAAFTQAEFQNVNTTQLREYTLTIFDSNYSLNWAGGSLGGPLRNYSGHPSGVYNNSNFLFLGDDTTSAGANIFLGNIEFQVIPEPGTWTLGTILLLGLGAFKIRRSRTPA